MHTNATAVADPAYPPLRIDATSELTNPFGFDVVVASLAYDVFVDEAGRGCNRTVSRYAGASAARAGASRRLIRPPSPGPPRA